MPNSGILRITSIGVTSSQAYPSVSFVTWGSTGNILSNGTFSHDYATAITSTQFRQEIERNVVDAYVSYMAAVPVITVDKQDVILL